MPDYYSLTGVSNALRSLFVQCFLIKNHPIDYAPNSSILWLDSCCCVFGDTDKAFQYIEKYDYYFLSNDQLSSVPPRLLYKFFEDMEGHCDLSYDEDCYPLSSLVIGFKHNHIPDFIKKYADFVFSNISLLKSLDSNSLNIMSARIFSDALFSLCAFNKLNPTFYHGLEIITPSKSHNFQTLLDGYKPVTDDLLSSYLSINNINDCVNYYFHNDEYFCLEGLRFTKPSKTLVVLGNGPSLNNADFNDIFQFDTIGMNAAYRYWDAINKYPTYYSCFDFVVQESHKAEIYRLIQDNANNGIRRFFLRKTFLDFYPDIEHNPCVQFYEDICLSNRYFDFSRVTTGSHSLLIGWYLGYRNIKILGVDLNYIEQVQGATLKPGRVLEIEDDSRPNPNYFFDGYQQKGDRYNPPNPNPGLHLSAWEKVASLLDQFPIDIENLNPDSAVKNFKFSTWEAFLSSTLSEQKASEVLSKKQSIVEKIYWRTRHVSDIRRFQEKLPATQQREKVDIVKRVLSHYCGFTIGHHYDITDAVFESGWGNPYYLDSQYVLSTSFAHEHVVKLPILQPHSSFVLVFRLNRSSGDNKASLPICRMAYSALLGRRVLFRGNEYFVYDVPHLSVDKMLDQSIKFSLITGADNFNFTGLYWLANNSSILKSFPFSHFDSTEYMKNNPESIDKVLSGNKLSLLDCYLHDKHHTADYISTSYPVAGYRSQLV